MIFQFLYLSLQFIQHRAFSPSGRNGTARQVEAKKKQAFKAQADRVSCLLKPHKLIMRSKLSFYVSGDFLLSSWTEIRRVKSRQNWG